MSMPIERRVVTSLEPCSIWYQTSTSGDRDDESDELPGVLEPGRGGEVRIPRVDDKHVADTVPRASCRRNDLPSTRTGASAMAVSGSCSYEIEGDVADALGALREAANSGAVDRPDPTCVAGDIFSQIYHPIGVGYVEGLAEGQQ